MLLSVTLEQTISDRRYNHTTILFFLPFCRMRMRRFKAPPPPQQTLVSLQFQSILFFSFCLYVQDVNLLHL